MKRILGLDLGSASIGWAVIEENSKEVVDEQSATNVHHDKILGLGSRIIPLSVDESTQFSKGQAISKNAERTAKRTQRKGYDRYQLRRALLLEKLSNLGMYDGQTLKLSKLDLWGLRAKAANEQISLKELGRVLCHLNQKRGYRTIKSDFGDKQQSEYVQAVVGRYGELHEQGVTIGQYMYNGLKSDPSFRCKERIYPRDAYIEEYDAIMACQRVFYQDVLTDSAIAHIRDYIIFHQRPLKSCKHLVSKCELERHDIERNGRIYNCGPKVTPRSSPLFQVCKIWESINNLNIRNNYNKVLPISIEQKRAIFDFMNSHEKLKVSDLKSLLGVKSREWQFGKAIGSGLQGNTTYCAIAQALGNLADKDKLLRFDLHQTDGSVDTETGEIAQVIDSSFEREPLYRLWHTLYSISDITELQNALRTRFGIDDDSVLDALCRIDFVKSGYGNKSSRAIRRILPYLQDGMQYYDAKCAAGYDDTTLTTEQNEMRPLADSLKPIQKGELRQPVVEKILNQLVNLVNALMSEYGRFDEIRVELSRELKQNREERESADKAMNRAKNENERITKILKGEYALTTTRSRIQKYKMWEESKGICIYCGQTVNVKEFLRGFGVEIEHIIPRSVLFDDSFSNKVCACRACNKEKNNRTAYDYMKSKSEGEFNAYISRVADLAEKRLISKSKHRKLLMSASELPDDFIERQLRESQYIAKKAKEMLLSVCRNVYATSGSITDFIRHIWGWDNILHDLNFERYRNAGLTQNVEREINEKKVVVERIANWSKRMDHRHHAIDALTIACTKQGYIQRINNLNTLKEVAFCSYSNENQGEASKQRLTRLERYIAIQPHLSTEEVTHAVDRIAVSFKSGKRAASIGKRYVYRNGKRICKQDGIIIPRGALHDATIYGRIHDSQSGKDEYVVKYQINKISPRDVKFIVDKRIREIMHNRLEQYGDKTEKAFSESVLDHQGREIRSVRCYTGVNAIVPLQYNEKGDPIAFVKPGNNHHVAIYEDQNGKLHEHVVTFWHAVERKKYRIPTIISNPSEIWDSVTNEMPESFLRQLPESANWHLKFSMQQNEMFILGMSDEEYADAIDAQDYAALNRHLYRVQKITSKDYYFRHHLATTTDDKYGGAQNTKASVQMKMLIRINSIGAFIAQNPHKVHVSITGKITEI